MGGGRVDVDDGVAEGECVDDLQIGEAPVGDGEPLAPASGVLGGVDAGTAVLRAGSDDPGPPLDDSTLDAFAAAESELVPYLAPLRVAGCARAMAAWRESVADVPAPAEPERALFLWPRSMAATSSTVTSTPRAAPS